MSEITNEFKYRVVEAIKENVFRYKTNKAQATSLDISPAQFSRITNGDIDKVISDDKWNQIASKYNVSSHANNFQWQPAYTAVYDKIYSQLTHCQSKSISGMFCDLSDIGKSFTAKDYVSKHRNAILIDCSQNKSRTELLRAMAKEFGIDHKISVRKLQYDLVQYMRAMTRPLVIMDEFGDLSYPAFLEVKALWNATEWRCGWYMMGADGLAEKLDRNRDNKKVGYAEIFSRLGSKYQHIIPKDENDRKQFLIKEIARILKINKSKLNPLQMYAKTGGSLRRVYIEILKEHEAVAVEN